MMSRALRSKRSQLTLSTNDELPAHRTTSCGVGYSLGILSVALIIALPLAP